MTSPHNMQSAASQMPSKRSTPLGLSAAQLASYQRDGFLVLEDFATSSECQQLMGRAGELLAEFQPSEHKTIFSTHTQERDQYFLDSGEDIRFFFEEDAFDSKGQLKQPKAQSINKIGHALHDRDPVFRAFSLQAKIAAVAFDLGLKRPQVLQSMYIFKQPRIGGEVCLHQDSTFLYTDPLSTVGFWFALEDATEENGCLQALPGGHKIDLKQRYKLDHAGSTCFETFDSSPFPDQPLQCLPVKAGAMIILHGQLPHYSAANRSARSRQAYTLHLIDAEADYSADNWLQRRTPAPILSRP